jgi:hypothetical protein
MDDKGSRSKSEVIGIRLTREEFERFSIIVDKAKARNSLSDRAAVARELIGFPAVPQTVTDEDRQFLISESQRVEVVPPGRLTRKQEGLLQKVKEILLHGHDENPENDLSYVIIANIEALWLVLKSRSSSKEKKSKTKTKNSSSVSRSNVDSDTKEGDRPSPG